MRSFMLFACSTVGRRRDRRAERSENLKNKKLYRAFGQQADRLTLNIPVLQGLLKVNRKAEKDP